MKLKLFRVIAVGLLLVLAVAALPAMAESDVVLNIDKILWIGQGYVSVYVDNLDYGAQIVSVKSTSPSVLKVRYEEDDPYYFDVKPLKAGKSTLKFTYKLNGKKTTVKKTITVKKYPNAIASLTVNGTKVSFKKNRFTYTVSKFKKRAVTIKVKPAKGWKIKGMYTDLEYIGYREIKNGQTFKLDKEGRGDAWIELVNSKNQIFRYWIEINRV